MNISGSSSMMGMMTYQTGMSSGAQGMQGPPPPPQDGSGSEVDPLGIYEAVDTDGDGSVSESEFTTLTEGLLEITGSSISSSFSDYDTDGDGSLSGEELKSVMDDSGIAPPPPPPEQVSAAYEAQSGDSEDLMSQLLIYLETESETTDITA